MPAASTPRGSSGHRYRFIIPDRLRAPASRPPSPVDRQPARPLGRLDRTHGASILTIGVLLLLAMQYSIRKAATSFILAVSMPIGPSALVCPQHRSRHFLPANLRRPTPSAITDTWSPARCSPNANIPQSRLSEK